MINWFEIPVSDFNRAKAFYEAVFQENLHLVEMGDVKMGMLPSDGHNISGAIVQGDEYQPSSEGCMLYLNARNDIPGFLARIEQAGGKVLVQKTEISPDFGYFAIFLDPEGNKMALHSMQ